MSQGKPFGALFLSAGSSKTGTTWLYSVLTFHPQLYFTPEKEIHYFHYKYANKAILSDERRLSNAKTRILNRIDPARSNIARIRHDLDFMNRYLASPIDDTWYGRLFKARKTGAYGCDFSNFTALLPREAWGDIAAQCDKLRVLYTMRDPAARLWSHVKFHLQVTGQTDVLNSWGPKDFAEFARRPFIWDNCEYGAALRKMIHALPPGTVRAQFHEDMVADPRATLAGIEAFLQIAPFDYPEDRLAKRVNASASLPMPDYLPDLFREDFTRITREVENVGLTIPASWRVYA